MSFDLVLSSGFLAFGRQTGVLAAVEELGLPVDGVCGTSSGAIAGALWSSGMPAREVLARLSEGVPILQVRPSLAPWRGAFSLDPVIERLRADLPARIEDLPRPFGVGVTSADGRGLVLTAGALPEAVAASSALPYVFGAVRVDGVPYRDGGMVDRTGLAAWRAHRPDVRVVLHLVERSHGAVGEDPSGDVIVVRTPRSGARLWRLGDVQARFEEARALALDALRPLAG